MFQKVIIPLFYKTIRIIIFIEIHLIMATRANVFIRDNKSDREKEILYHHWDGYPDGVGLDLAGILNTIPKEKIGLLTKRSLAQLINEKISSFEITTPNEIPGAEYIYEVDLSQRRVDWIHLTTGEQEWLCDF